MPYTCSWGRVKGRRLTLDQMRCQFCRIGRGLIPTLSYIQDEENYTVQTTSAANLSDELQALCVVTIYVHTNTNS